MRKAQICLGMEVILTTESDSRCRQPLEVMNRIVNFLKVSESSNQEQNRRWKILES
ncbi:hypothetical protein HanXRQr2_Chr04g0168881 [Helianthus annuus]|uniref:Uncharacterized protein n=1 Tax=Helianthus annuus TaxID=4232 RepID=A0A9K3NS15_HELAN|nr:hypothetical protein HanXRQr2_Chr04g0168881 [Helianthus annuus]KAJ0931515.1 hypothetical protein HanPSC8_Chr04g0162541 [Helianthus annuus]